MADQQFGDQDRPKKTKISDTLRRPDTGPIEEEKPDLRGRPSLLRPKNQRSSDPAAAGAQGMAAWRRAVSRPGQQPTGAAPTPGYSSATQRPTLDNTNHTPPGVVPESAYICPSCDAANPPNAVSCWRCGMTFGSNAAPTGRPAVKKPSGNVTKLCIYCQAPNRPEDLFCQRCHQPLPVSTATSKPARRSANRFVALAVILLILIAASAALFLRPGGSGPAPVSAQVPPGTTATPPVDSTATAVAVAAEATVVAQSTAEAQYAESNTALLTELAAQDADVEAATAGLSGQQPDYAAAGQKITASLDYDKELQRRLDRSPAPIEHRPERALLNTALQKRGTALNSAADFIAALGEWSAGQPALAQAKQDYDAAQAQYDKKGDNYNDLIRAKNAYNDLNGKYTRLKTRAEQSENSYNIAWQDYKAALELFKNPPTPAPETATPTLDGTPATAP